MSNVKFSQLPNLGTITANTIVPVVAAGTNYTITAANLQSYVNSSTGNITGNYFIGNGSQLTGIAASYGNANVVANLAALGSNPISTTGNISAGYFIGNGSQLTGIASSSYGNSNVTVLLAALGSNIISGTGNVTTTANIAGNYILGNGSQLTGLPATYGNADVVANLAALGSNPISTTGNVSVGYIIGNGSALTNITGANVTGTVANATYAVSAGSATTATTAGTANAVAGANVSGTVSSATTAGTVTTNAQPNITSVGILSSARVSGNVTGGNVSIVGGTLAFANASIVQSNPLDLSITGVYQISVKPAGGSYQWTFGNDGALTGPTGVGVIGYVSAGGNVTGGNIGTAGVISATGNITAGGLTVNGTGVVTGNLQVQGNLIYNNLTNITTSNLVFGLANTTTGISANGAGFVVGNTNEASFLYNYSAQAWNSNIGVSAVGNVTGGNVLSAGVITAAGNITGGNLRTAGVITATGNVSGNYILGNGSQLTGLPAIYGNANVVANLAALGSNPVSTTGNITGGYIIGNGSQLTGLPAGYTNSNVSTFLAAFGSNTVSTTGNITGGYMFGNGSTLTSLTGANVTGTVANATYALNANSASFANHANITDSANAVAGANVSGQVANAVLAGTVYTNSQPNITSVGILSSVSVTANITGGNVLTVGTVSATGNITGGNVSATNIVGTLTTAAQTNITSVGTLGALTVTANVTGGNILTAGVISSTGNITGGNILATNHTGATASVTGNVTGGNVLFGTGVVSGTGNIFGNNLSLTGNTTPGNVLTTGLITATGNITGGNIATAGQVSATGNITTANSFVGNLVGTTVSVTGNVTAGNVIATGVVVNGQPTTYGYVNGAYLLAQNNADQSAGQNVAVNFQTTSASNGSIITKTSNSQVTLTGGNTYKLEAIVRRLTSSSTWGTFRWYDVTNAAYVGIEGFSEVATSTGPIGSTTVATVYVTPSVNTIYELRQTTVNTISVSANYATIEITQVNPTIAVQATATGTVSKNYSKYTRTASQSVSANSVIVCNVSESTSGTAVSVNTSTGQVTLTAGTYRLRGTAGTTVGGAAASLIGYGWYNETTSAWIGEGAGWVSPASTNYNISTNGTAEAVITVASSAVVSLRVISTTNVSSIGGNQSDFAGTYANPWIDIEQMGATFALNALDTMSTTGNVSVGGNLNVTGTSTSLVTKASGLVNAGVDVTLGNLKARIPTSGNRSLQLSTVSGTYTVYGSDVYSAGGAGGATIDGATPLTVTTTPAYLRAPNNFNAAGQTDVWTIMDTGAGLAWRITCIIGIGYNNNMISIERLV